MPHDSWADYYDLVYELTYGDSYQRFTELTLTVVRELLPPPGRIIEYGAGTGRLAIPLSSAGYRVTAVEAAVEMCKVLTTKALREGAMVSVLNQSICQPLSFDLGLCVFTVPNYIVNATAFAEFARAASQAIRSDGKLLISFTADMRRLQKVFAEPVERQCPDRHCNMSRRIGLSHLEGPVFSYHEKTDLTIQNKRIGYEDEFKLHEWSVDEITERLGATGFTLEADLSWRFAGTGEVYLLFSRSASNLTADWKPSIPPRSSETTLMDQIHEYADLVATLTYEVDPHNTGRGRFRVTPLSGPLPTTRGIYFLISGADCIEKVGRTDGKRGLKSRMRGYTQWTKNTDSTMRLWHRVMTTELDGQALKLYFVSSITNAIITFLGEPVEVQMSPYADLESHFIAKAKASHLMRLSQ